MIIRNGMTDEEKNILTEMLFNREDVLARNFLEIGKFKKQVAPSQKIQTIGHKAWQVPRL